MWVMILLFGITSLLLGWLLFGFLIWLRFADRQPAAPRKGAAEPSITVIVPCLNEEELISAKLENLRTTNYPPDRVEFVFADGGSDDRTVPVLRELTAGEGAFRVVECPSRGKINQLNHVLAQLGADIVVITDTDARWEPETLHELAREFADTRVAAVGALTSPRGGLAVERCYWAAQNRVRLLESRAGSVSTMVACCYGFRRDLLPSFPADVVADDVYVCVLANTQGFSTVYSERARVQELRTPATLPAFFRHKFRKGNAVLREMLRLSYRVPEMAPTWRTILTTRIGQQLILPWSSILWVCLAAAMINAGQYDVPALGSAFLLAGMLAARKAVGSVELPQEALAFDPLTIALAFAYTMVILVGNGLTYLTFRQDSSYARLPMGTGTSLKPPRVAARTAPISVARAEPQPGPERMEPIAPVISQA